MGDIGVVRGSDFGCGRAVKMLAGGAIEEGDLVAFGALDGEIVKVASDGVDAIGVAMEDIADEASGMIWRVGPNAIVEGAVLSTCTTLLQGDEVGIDVTDGVITFDEDVDHIVGYVYKVTKTDSLGQATRVQVRLIGTGQKI